MAIRPSSRRPATFCRLTSPTMSMRRDRETGDNFDEGVHLALGAAGYLEGEWKGAADGWLSPGSSSYLGIGEASRARSLGNLGGPQPWWPRSVARFGSPELRSEVIGRKYSAARVRLCLGYTEPEGGSDIADL